MLNPENLVEKYAIGQPVPRTEDPALVQGKGRYTDDVDLPGQAYAFIVRSPVAHGIINAIDLSAAREMPGVLAAFDGAEMQAAGFGPLKCRIPMPNADGSPMAAPLRPALAMDKARFVGDPVACIVAETLAQARDAAEAVGLDIESLPAVTSARAAAAPDAPLVFDDVPGNVQLDFHTGDRDAVAQAFAEAAHVVRMDLNNTRLIVAPMEPRSCAVQFDEAEGYTLHVCSQGVVNMKNQFLNDILPKDSKLRVLTGSVGGSFGMKFSAYPEYVCAFHAAKICGRPVKWTDDRSSAFLSDQHGRDHEYVGELALDKDGHFLAVRITGHANVGAYLTSVITIIGTRNILQNLIGHYRTPLAEIAVKDMFTNTSPVGAYRGAGRPEANFFMESLIDRAARKMGIDRVEIRRRNQIAASEIPYKAGNGSVYDSGDFPGILDRTLDLADWDGFSTRRADSEARGLIRGLGLGCYLEATAGPMPESVGIRFEADGSVSLITGTLDYGQGHSGAFAQVLADKLGVPFDKIRLIQGDSNVVPVGSGSGGSRSAMNSGGYIVEAAKDVVEKGKIAASHVLEAAVADIEFSRGRFAIAGTDRGIGVMELAARLRAGLALPEGAPDTLDTTHIGKGMPATYPNGAHVCEVEIDPETGVTRVVRYVNVNDFGTLINPMLVEGQLHGGVAQGIGQAIMERVVYDEDGNLISGSFMDYALPRADDIPFMVTESRPQPATTNPLGVKGCGEAGCAGSLTSVTSAIRDALWQAGVTEFEMPATPLRIWEALRNARTGAN
jgi:carbon-monoxide dehydrogenase large subunit